MRADQILGKLRFWKEVDFKLNGGKMVFLAFSQKEAVFGKTLVS